MKKIFRILMTASYSRLRSFFLFFVALLKGSIFHPLSSVGRSGCITIAASVTIRKIKLDPGVGCVSIHKNVWVNEGVEVSAFNNVTIGEGTTLQKNVTINGDVVVGAGCLFAPNVFISSFSHVFDRFPGIDIRSQERMISKEDFIKYYNKPVFVGDGVWLGVNSVVLPGVKVSSHAVIGANSVVTKDVPKGAVVAGIPAKILKFRSGFEDV